MGENIATSFSALNYSGALFNKGNTATPLSTLIGANRKTTNSKEFAVGQGYTVAGGTQPEITEAGSLTAPDATFITRGQITNVTQIFHESVYTSYVKDANMGELAALNIAGQAANPADEMDFQIQARMQKIANDIEATFVAGAYSKAAAVGEANKSRGVLTAVVDDNIVLADGGTLGLWTVAEAMQRLYSANAPTDGLVLLADSVSLYQLNADAVANGLTIADTGREVNGINIKTLITPLGEVGVLLGKYLPAGTVGLINPGVMAPVEQPHPEKGNFFLEEIGKVGAGTKYQIFGMVGLDHGPGWYHAKITGLSEEFVAPESGKRIYTTTPILTNEVLPTLTKATLPAPAVYNVNTEALVMTYHGIPKDTVTFAYQWQVAATANGEYADIDTATSAVYKPVAGDKGKFIRCKVTATAYAEGTVYTNAEKVLESAP